jgi:hypothetical protein
MGWGTPQTAYDANKALQANGPPPVLTVATMSATDRLAKVLELSKKNFGPDVVQMIDAMLSPLNLGIMAGTLALWAGSHLFGVGEIVDVLLLLVGAFTIGWSITDVASDLYTFGDLTINGKSDADLEKAAKAFSHAVVLTGITIVMALLLRKSVKEITAARGATVAEAITPKNPGLPKVGPDPEAGRMWSKPGISSDPSLSAGEGTTSAFGEVRLSPKGTATEQALVRAHEMVHRFLAPRLGILRTFRAQVGMSGYVRSAFLQYLEEAIAETVAQLRVNGLSGALEGVKFPVSNGYVSINSLMSEGRAIGTITVGTQIFSVQFIPASPPPKAPETCEAPKLFAEPETCDPSNP